MKHKNYDRPNYKLWQIIGIFFIAISSTFLGVRNLLLFVDFITPENQSVTVKSNSLLSN